MKYMEENWNEKLQKGSLTVWIPSHKLLLYPKMNERDKNTDVWGQPGYTHPKNTF
jgi:hypothetical protein